MVDVGTVFGFFVNGLVFGSILALGAIGLSLVYGILKLSNFAHGDLLSLGAFLMFVFAVQREGALAVTGVVLAALLLAAALVDRFWTRRLTRGERNVLLGFALGSLVPAILLIVGAATPRRTTGLEILVATSLSIAAVVVLVVGMDLAIWRPLRRRSATPLTLIIVSIGVALVVRNGLLLEFGGGLHRLLRPTAVAPVILGAHVSHAQQFALLSSILVVAGVHLFLKKTQTGKAMRALSDNLDLARLCGINVDRVILYVWTLAGSLIAFAGLLLTLFQSNSLYVGMGFSLLIPLFAAVILGGIGNPYGAVLGAFIVGIAMKTSIIWWGAQYELASAFLILAAVMLVRPQGLLGGRVA